MKNKKTTKKPRGRPLGSKIKPLPLTGNLREPFTADRKKLYCKIISETADKLLARTKIGISPSTVTDHLKKDPGFRQLYEDSMESFRMSLVEAAVKRGVKGLRRGLYYKGRPTEDKKGKPVTELHFSDRMLEKLLDRYIPEFGKKQVEVTNVMDFDIEGVDLSKLTGKQRKQFRELLEASKTDEEEKE